MGGARARDWGLNLYDSLPFAGEHHSPLTEDNEDRRGDGRAHAELPSRGSVRQPPVLGRRTPAGYPGEKAWPADLPWEPVTWVPQSLSVDCRRPPACCRAGLHRGDNCGPEAEKNESLTFPESCGAFV